MATLPRYPSTLPSGLSKTGKPRRRHPVRTVLLVLLAAAVVVSASAGAYLFSLGQLFDAQTTTIDNAFPAESTRPAPRQPDAPAAVPGAAGAGPAPAAGAPPSDANDAAHRTAVNILLMGTDSRGATAGAALSGGPSNQRADTLMLVHIPANRAGVFSVSLMRDLWIGIPEHGHAKINAALAFGGVPLMVQTVEAMFGQRIDHVAMIDFRGFVAMTDALGGVEVTVTQPFVSIHSNRAYAQGPALLDGKAALDFVRERYAYADGDYQRVRNQQAFVRALLAKNLSPETLLNPVKLHNAISAIAPFISVDSGLDAATLARLALELRDVRAADLVMFTLPTLGIGTSADGQSIVLPDYRAVAGIAQALADDSLDTFVASEGLAGGH